MIEINWLGVVLAAVSSMVVGSIWYAPQVFGKRWMKLVGLSQKDMSQGGWTPLVIAVIVSFVTAYVLAHVIVLSNTYFGNSFFQDALMTGFWVWLGFIAARMVTHDVFEKRPQELTLMNITHELVTIMLMALIIGLIGV